MDAPRAAGRFPLVLIGQGNGQAPPDQAVLAEFLASHGLVIATTPSPTLRSPMKSADDVGPFAQRQAEALSRAASLLDGLGGVDAARMGVVGHSFGARAALLVAMHDARTRAVVSLDGGIGTAQGVESFRSAPWFDASRVTPPILHLYETADSFMSPDFALLRQLRGPLTVEEVSGLRHVHFTTLGFKAVEDPEMGRLTAMGTDGPVTIRNMATRVLAFLQQHLNAAGGNGQALSAAFLAWSVDHASGCRAGVLAVLQHLGAVHEDVHHPGRVLMGLLERRMILHCGRVEDDDVREVAGSETAALLNLERLRGL
jgi:dienelactone hydrolase